ncbi:hypothetical protein [Listeria monocytogenes]|uniref:hypothetical protein n=1 Tax=Listeria monocytogenes TaxID=1639 RepID=UPI001357D279|nr:hypothetical protein [Listeria monocytogenes]
MKVTVYEGSVDEIKELLPTIMNSQEQEKAVYKFSKELVDKITNHQRLRGSIQ